MSIGKLCTNDVVTIQQNDSIQNAAKLMGQKRVGSLVVIDDQTQPSKPIGIVTDRDIALTVVAENKNIEATKVSDVMSKNILTLESNQGIKEAIEMMSNKGVRRAPIVENGKLCGITSIDDLVALIAQELNALSCLVKKQITA